MSEEKKAAPRRRSPKPSLPEKAEATPTLQIEVSKYNTLVKALEKGKWWHLMASIFAAGLLLFIGISVVALTIKRLYPYSDITTNGLGATTIKSEKGEVSYFLYNSASFWANSGISVEEGDVITVRASGKFHTAIHHLYDATKYNTNLKDKWIGSEGIADNPDSKTGSYQRRQFRIFPSMPTGALIMQVVSNNCYSTTNDPDANKDNFYFIGKEQKNLYIKHPGTLYFCLNDIVLDETTIKGMLLESLRGTKAYKDKKKEWEADTTGVRCLLDAFHKEYEEEFKHLEMVDQESFKAKDQALLSLQTRLANNDLTCINVIQDTVSAIAEKAPKRILYKRQAVLDAIDHYKNLNEKVKPHYLKEIANSFESLIKELSAVRAIGDLRLGVTKEKGKVISELEYYWKNKYETAWFDDNVGSFLVIIEKNGR